MQRLSTRVNTAAELQFIFDFITVADFGYATECCQLRSLWTAYCLHTDMVCDTKEYDNAILTIWSAVEKNTSCPWEDDEEEGIIGFELFDMYMGEELS